MAQDAVARQPRPGTCRRTRTRRAGAAAPATVLWARTLARSPAIDLAGWALASATLAGHPPVQSRAVAAVRRVARRVDAARSAESWLWRRATSDARVTIARTGTPWLRGRTHRRAASAVARLRDVRFAPVICIGRAMHPSCRAGGRGDRAHAALYAAGPVTFFNAAIVTASAAVFRIACRVGAHPPQVLGMTVQVPRRGIGGRRGRRDRRQNPLRFQFLLPGARRL